MYEYIYIYIYAIYIYIYIYPPAPACQGPQAVEVGNLSPVSLSLDISLSFQLLVCWSFVLLFRAPNGT